VRRRRLPECDLSGRVDTYADRRAIVTGFPYDVHHRAEIRLLSGGLDAPGVRRLGRSALISACCVSFDSFWEQHLKPTHPWWLIAEEASGDRVDGSPLTSPPALVVPTDGYDETLAVIREHAGRPKRTDA
jgi:hypothetical protein